MYYLKSIPHPFRSYLLKLAGFLSIPGVKHAAEFDYWYTSLRKEGGTFLNGWYRGLMLQIADETDEDFVSGKVIADFGCGPRGSLCWADGAADRIGIDVLVDQYRRLNLDQQAMRYVQSSESSIPLASGSVDILFTVNALDHVDKFDVMCSEIHRILKPGGELIGSFNLEEAASVCEPQRLTEETIQSSLLSGMTIVQYRTAKQGPAGNQYCHFHDGSATPTEGPRYLWVRARKEVD